MYFGETEIKMKFKTHTTLYSPHKLLFQNGMSVFDNNPFTSMTDDDQVDTINKLLDTCNIFTSQENCLEVLFFDMV